MPTLSTLVAQLRMQRQALAGELGRIDAALAALSRGGAAPSRRKVTKASKGKPARKRKGMSAAQRKAVSARMKKYWAARRKAKG